MHTMRRLLLSFALLALMAPAAFAMDVIPYQADDWSYLQVTAGSPLEGSFMNPDFDDSAWLVGRAAFGEVHDLYCPLVNEVHTFWAIDSEILLRRHFEADPARPVTIFFEVDNDATIWVNGVQVASVTHESCATRDEWSATVLPGLLHLGSNLIAVKAVDRGRTSFFDLRMEGDQPVPTRNRTWGQLKLFHH